MPDYIDLMFLKCASCGASFSDFQGKDEVKCDFCNNVTKILRPVKVNADVDRLSQKDNGALSGYISILEKSMIAGNYKEAYDYCNKALEIDSNSAALWANKAISSFWIRSDKQIIESEAQEITTYLITAKNIDPNSPTYKLTANNISYNIYVSVLYKYILNGGDKFFISWDVSSYNNFITLIKMLEICFDISPETLYLDKALKEMIRWHYTIEQGNIKKTKGFIFNYELHQQRFVNKIKAVNPSYEPPVFKKGCFIATAALGNYDHPQVVELRNFRDDWILRRRWGRSFIEWYYNYGSKAAKYIEKSYVLKKISYFIIVLPLYYFSRLIRNK